MPDVTVTVRDNDTPGVTISETALPLDEGMSGAYTVVLETEPTANVTVTVEAPTGAELSLSSQSLTFSNSTWNTEQTVTVTALHDADVADEAPVPLTHAISGAAEYASLTLGTVDLKVTDDDEAGVTIAPTTLEIPEGQSRTYTVVLDTQPIANVTVAVTTPGGSDVTADPTSLTFTDSNWANAQTVTVSAAHDADALDDPATITHAASSTDGDYSGINVGDVDVTVIDDEDTPVTVSFGKASYSVAESDDPSTTNVTENEVTVTLSQDPEREVVISLFRVNQGGATSGDYSGVPAAVTFQSGDTEQTFTFSAAYDTLDDDGESVWLSFGNLPNAVTAGTHAATAVAITDDDQVPITDPNERPGFIKEIPYAEGSVLVRFDAERYSATEGGLDAIVTVRLDSSREEPVEIPLTAEGHSGATPGDWSGVPPVLTFGAWEFQKSFTLVAVDDTVEDDGEMVRLGFGTLPEGFVAGHPSSADVTLMNDDTEQPATCDSGI